MIHGRGLEAWGSVEAPAPAFVVVCLALFWVAVHPYAGIQHDGILYAAQALVHVDPAVLRGDLFFAYGSQDDYSVFGRLYAVLVGWLGLAPASHLLWAASQAMWFGVALAWLRRTLAPGLVLVAGAVFFAMPGWYGSELIFRVAEPFLTARSLAEPLVLAGLLASAAARPVATAVLLGAAFVVHPIMALPGIVAAGLLILGRSRVGRSLAAQPRVALAAVVLLACAAGVLLASTGAVRRIDDTWYGLVTARSTLVSPDRWGAADWLRVTLPPVFLLIAERDLDARARPLFVALAITGLIGIVGALIACLARWELGIQAQLWRLVWPATWSAPLAAIAVAAGLPAEQRGRRILFAAAVPAFVVTAQGWWDVGWALVVAWLLFLVAQRLGRMPERSDTHRVALVLAGLLLVASFADGVLAFHVRASLSAQLPVLETMMSSRTSLFVERFGWCFLPAFAYLLVRAAAPITVKGSTVQGRGALALGTLVVLAALPWYDGRTPVRLDLERAVADGIPDWTAAIPESSSVYWPHHVQRVWFVLGRKSYVSSEQLAGNVFSREKAVEGHRRWMNVAVLRSAEEMKLRLNVDARPRLEFLTRRELARACADPALDFVVLQKKLGVTVGQVYVDELAHREHHLHRCADYRDP